MQIPEDVILGFFGAAITGLTTGFGMLAKWVFGVVAELKTELLQCHDKHGAANAEANYLRGRVEEQSALNTAALSALPANITTAVITALEARAKV